MNENTPESTEPQLPPPAAPESVAAEAAPEAAPEAVAEAPAEASPEAAPEAPAKDVAAELKALFPALFSGGAKPLKLRIQADIQERAPGRFTKAQLSAFFRRYTGSTNYLFALTKAKTRFDLDGQPAGEIAEEHLTAAREELTRRKGLKEQRIAAERAAEREQRSAEREQADLLAQQRRNRAGLLHDYERTTLTLANFCVLKGTTPEELPGLLEIARQERAERPPMPEHAPRRAHDDRRPNNGDRRGPPRGGDRPAPRGPRPEGRREGGGREGGAKRPPKPN